MGIEAAQPSSRFVTIGLPKKALAFQGLQENWVVPPGLK